MPTSVSVLLAACALGSAVLSWPAGKARSRVGAAVRRPTAGSGPPSGAGPPRPSSAGQVPVTVVIELVAAALASGLPTGAALAAAVHAAPGAVADDLRPVVDAMRLGAGAELAWQRAGTSYALLARTLVLAERTGASAAMALRRTAADERAARRRRAQLAARRLGVYLVLPLGLGTLPAFVLLGVVPVVLGLAGQFLMV